MAKSTGRSCASQRQAVGPSPTGTVNRVGFWMAGTEDFTDDIDAGHAGGTGPHGRRRLVMASLVAGLLGAAAAALTYVLSADGIGAVDALLIVLFVASGIWPAIGAWNAVIGFALLRNDRVAPAVAVWPELAAVPANVAVRGRTAIVMPVYDEDPAAVFANLSAVARSVEETGCAEAFDIHLLSDSRSEAIAAEEARRVAAWNADPVAGFRLAYRRRQDNRGFKAGNIEEFCDRMAAAYDYMLVLDADSAMSGEAIVRLVRVMDYDDGLGIVQTLAVGAPAANPFTRLFQFGMRQGMRIYTMGSAWWQGPDGPYWGHNAILRLAPFAQHCRLPELPGSPPLGGPVLSHDQVEAVLMRRAGYSVRVLVEEGGSFEENPPTLIDFIRRDLRWCQGNMQYLTLLRRHRTAEPLLPGIRPMGLVQLGLAVLMYLGSVAWMAFMSVGLAAVLLAPADPDPVGKVAMAERLPVGIGLFVTMILVSMLPKLLGVADILCRPEARSAYGGSLRVLAGAWLELALSALISPVIAVAQCLFVARLAAGRGLTWQTQNRAARGLGLGEACRRLWPQTAIGLSVATMLAVLAPQMLGWAAPLLLGLVLAVPIALATAAPGLSEWMCRNRICAVPEEFRTPSLLAERAALPAVDADAHDDGPWPDQLSAPGRSLAPVGGDD